MQAPLAPLIGQAAGGMLALNAHLDHYSRKRRYEEMLQDHMEGRANDTAREVRQKLSLPSDMQGMARGASRTATRTRRRRTGRRYGRRRRIRRVPMQWPMSRLVKMRLVRAFTSTPDAAGQIKTHTLFWNTLNDPTSGLGAGLPLGMDQYAALYSRYCIVGARAFVRVHNVTSTGAVAYGLTSYEPSNTTAPASHEEAMELPHTRARILSPDVDHSGLGLSWSAKKAFKVRNIKDASELHGDLTLTPTSPTKVARFYLWSQDVNSTETHTIEGFLTMEFIVLLFDRVNPTRSSL